MLIVLADRPPSSPGYYYRRSKVLEGQLLMTMVFEGEDEGLCFLADSSSPLTGARTGEPAEYPVSEYGTMFDWSASLPYEEFVEHMVAARA
jgi:hypothetical protein